MPESGIVVTCGRRFFNKFDDVGEGSFKQWRVDL